MNSVDRRTFLKGVAAAASAASVVPLPVLGAPVAQAPLLAARTWTRSPCVLCGVACGLQVAVDGGRAVAVRGDPTSASAKGMACVKGYHAVQGLYGTDRIRRAQLRRSGALVDVPLGEALDAVANALRETVQRHGRDSASLLGSAHWTIADAYVAAKLFKGGIGTNNVDSATRMDAAAAAAGLRSTFGLDAPIATYEDVDHADVVVLWDTNLAESDPVLFSRILDRRRADPAVRVVDVTTRTTRTSYGADRSLVHVPHTGLAIANALCQEIVARRWANREFIERHAAFRRGPTNIGHGLTDDALIADTPADATWDEFVAFLARFTPDTAQAASGIPAEQIRWLASLYGDRARRVVTIWDGGVHHSVRGAWLNNALYNVHLLVGKLGTPGNAALALTGHAGGGCDLHAAGAAPHALPRGDVRNEADRRRAADIWGVPFDRLDAWPGRTALGTFRALERGDVRFLWIQGANPMLSLPNAGRYRGAARRPDRFIVVSDAYPTPTTDIADVVLPSALWVEREGATANVERRVQHIAALVTPPGDATGVAWQMIEVARRTGLGELFAWERRTHTAQAWEEYRRFHDDVRSGLPSIEALRARGAIQWPTTGPTETTRLYATAHDPAADAAHGALDFYGHEDHRAWIWIRPAEPPAESPDREFPFWLETGPVLEHSNDGSLTQRIPTLHRSVPRAYVEIHRDDATRLGIRHGETVRLISRRGSLAIEARIDYRAQPARGRVFVPLFDEGRPVNLLTLDAQCPVSGQVGAGVCAVRVERLSRGATP